MKRGGPLQRKTPLTGRAPKESGTTWRQRSELRRHNRETGAGKPIADRFGPQPKARSRPADTGPTPEVRAIIHERSGGLCERCYNERAVDQHHRCGRQMGGSRKVLWINLPSNVVDLCDPCHDEVGSRVTEARAAGWIVPRGVADQDGGSSATPVRDLLGGWWLLHDAGTKARIPPP